MAKYEITLVIRPIITAACTVTKPAAGVIATKPAIAPDIAPSTVGLPVLR